MNKQYYTFNKLAQSRKNEAFALVLVLGVLVLLTVLIVTLFTKVTSDYAAAKQYESGADSQALADSAVNVVMSQIRDATAGFKKDGVALDLEERLGWASQPGMIRTWDDDGNLHQAFRLYSWNEMVLNAPDMSNVQNQERTEIQDWKLPDQRSPYNAVFADLNSPAMVPAQALDATVDLDGDGDNDHRPVYPIAYPPVTASGDFTGPDDEVAGYSTTAPPGFDSDEEPSSANNPVPMPVKWMYMLEDGTLAPSSGTIGAETVQVPKATDANPIVARIAFWADDDTAKVNINTASEGVFWDYPRAVTDEEKQLGRFQPVSREFNRYPGHPAMTSLSTIFPEFGDPNKMTEVLEMLPRYQWGGSEGGTFQPGDPLITGDSDDGPMEIEEGRLYASVDDFLYNPQRDEETSLFTKEELKQRRFFITASSRAPETNMFNMPRISLWPINTANRASTSANDNSRQSAFDRLLKFCAQIGKEAGAGNDDDAHFNYFFLRANNWSPTFDYTNIERNQELYEYLQRLTQADIPGFGASFTSKYGTDDTNALLTQAFDFIRSGPDPMGMMQADLDNGLVTNGYTNNDEFRWNRVFAGWNGHGLQNLVVPIKIGDTKGMGQFVQPVEAALMFRVEDSRDVSDGSVDNNTVTPGIEIDSDETTYYVRAYLLLAAYKPGYGWVDISPANTVGNKYGDRVRDNVGVSYRIVEQSGLGLRAVGADAVSPIDSDPATPIVFPEDVAVPYLNVGGATDYRFGTQDAGFVGVGKLIPLAVDSETNYVGGKYFASNRIPLTFTTPEHSDPDLDRPYEDDDVGYFYPGVRDIEAHDTAPDSGVGMQLVGGSVTLQLLFHDPTGGRDPVTDPHVIQEFEVDFPSIGRLVVPNMDYDYNDVNEGAAPEAVDDAVERNEGIRLVYSGTIYQAYDITQNGDDELRDNVNVGSDLWESANVIRGVALDGQSGLMGDYRLAALRSNLPADWFQPMPNETGVLYYSDALRVHSLGRIDGSPRINSDHAKLVEDMDYHMSRWSGNSNEGYRLASANLDGAYMANGAPGDWNNSYGDNSDGAVFSLPDSGATGRTSTVATDRGGGINDNSYFNFLNIPDSRQHIYQFHLTFSPNRQVYSGMQMGSLLTEAVEGNPWQTLLFSPVSAAATSGEQHPGEVSPPDHLFADLFWMPVVEPYPISDPLSTAGKINLNYQMRPFDFIERSTGIHSLFKATRVTGIDDEDVNVYKHDGNNLASYRNEIDTDRTLQREFKTRFDAGDLFRSSSQIAEVVLWPEGAASDINAWWGSRRLTGDNTREQPYAHLMSRLTTKSNTYTVHYRVQILQKRSGSPSDEWDESSDAVMAESRGSVTLERFIDPNDPELKDFASLELDDADGNIDKYYRFRILDSEKFDQ